MDGQTLHQVPLSSIQENMILTRVKSMFQVKIIYKERREVLNVMQKLNYF